MNKEELLSFSLWAKYSEFLLSLKEAFGKEAEAALNAITNSVITSEFYSEFYDENGKIKDDRTTDYPDYEVIYFKAENKKNFIDFSFSYGITSSLSVNFWFIGEKNGEENEDVLYEYVCNTDSLFSLDVIGAVVYWIETGELDDFAKSVAVRV